MDTLKGVPVASSRCAEPAPPPVIRLPPPAVGPGCLLAEYSQPPLPPLQPQTKATHCARLHEGGGLSLVKQLS